MSKAIDLVRVCGATGVQLLLTQCPVGSQVLSLSAHVPQGLPQTGSGPQLLPLQSGRQQVPLPLQTWPAAQHVVPHVTSSHLQTPVIQLALAPQLPV